jgi:hypothetical protein
MPHPQDSFHYTSGILTFAQGDIDGDSDIDIVGADFYSAGGSDSKIWLNDGTGYFSATIPLPALVNNATDVELVDLDGDLDLDMVVARTEEMPEVVAFNNGQGGFEQITEFDTGFTFQIVAADFDGDDHPDILAINELDPDPFDPHPTDARERLWLNDGTGAFKETARLDFGNWTDAKPADLDGDLDLDLVVSNTQGTTIWLNDGVAHFKATQQAPPANGIMRAVGDVDGDSDIDMLGFLEDGEVLSVGKNDGQGAFSFEQNTVTGAPNVLLRLGDLDHDNDVDALRYGWNEPFSVLLNDSHGHFMPAQVFGGATVSQVLLADVNNDTWLDMLAGHNPHISQDPSAPSVWLNEAVTIRGTIYLPMIRKP